MPHGLSRNPDGSWEGMFVGEMPWHRLGTILEKRPGTAADAIMAAHLTGRQPPQAAVAESGLRLFSQQHLQIEAQIGDGLLDLLANIADIEQIVS